MGRGEDGFQSVEHLVGHLPPERPLFGEAKRVFLRAGVGVARLEVLKSLNPSVGQTGPPTESLVVMPSDVAVGELGYLEVGKSSKPRVEVTSDDLGHCHGGVEHLRGVGKRTIHVGHPAEL